MNLQINSGKKMVALTLFLFPFIGHGNLNGSPEVVTCDSYDHFICLLLTVCHELKWKKRN